MAMFALKTAGGVNIAQDAQQVRNTNIAFYGKERILSHADEIDVFIAQQGAMNRPTIALIKAETGFSAIKAIKNNQILIIDEMIVSRPTLRLIDGIMETGMYLYPTIFNPKPAKPASGS
jgi:iron complex transport system substrate-binding protein